MGDDIICREIRRLVQGNTARQVTLMNLCGALTTANLLFIVGVDKTEIEVSEEFDSICRNVFQNITFHSIN